MSKVNTKSKKGFTIIEVVLVLAIAGLIFLMVFIALPALQQSQRNTQRKDDLSRILTAITEFQSNNNGRIPFASTTSGTAITVSLEAGAGGFATRYIDSGCSDITLTARPTGCGDQFTDPDGSIYQFRGISGVDASGVVTFPRASGASGPITFAQAEHTIFLAPRFVCGTTEGTARAGTGPRQIAIFMVLEGDAIACNDNQ